MKATMMKISDPIIFGHCVNAYYKVALEEQRATLEATVEQAQAQILRLEEERN